jgi:hypothetical protein
MGRAVDVTPLSFFKDTIVVGTVSRFINRWNEDAVRVLEGNFQIISSIYPACEPCGRAAIETLSFWVLSISEDG